MNRWITCLALIMLFACKHKKRDSTENYFSAVTFLQTQARLMDTAQFKFIKIETVDSTSDTTSIPRQDFRKYAKDFLTLPDISGDDKHDDYEESNTYDEDLNYVLLTYTPKNDDEEIRRQTVMLEPNEFGDSKVRTILVNRIIVDKDSTIEKEMTWHVDRRFQIVTKITKGNQPEKIKTMVIKWE